MQGEREAILESNVDDRKKHYDNLLRKIKTGFEMSAGSFDSKNISVALQVLGEGYLAIWNGKVFSIRINPEKMSVLTPYYDFDDKEAFAKWKEGAWNCVDAAESAFRHGVNTCATIASTLALKEKEDDLCRACHCSCREGREGDGRESQSYPYR